MAHEHDTRINGRQLTTAVPRELVHKRAHSEVLLTGWTTHEDDRHTVRAQWPRLHSFYWPRNQNFDPLLFVETVRQTFPLLSHTAYGVPFDHHLVWDDFHYQVNPPAMRVPDAPADLVLEIACKNVKTRNNRLVSMSMEATAFLAGQRVGTASTRFTSHAPALYRRLRGQCLDPATVRRTALPLPPALSPTAVGHLLPQNVVLADAPEKSGRWQIRVDLDHPVLFDHPVDHAPGMLLMEAVRQAAHAMRPTPNTMVTAMSVSFTRWVALDQPCWVSVAPLSHNTLRATVEQAHNICVNAELTIEETTLGQLPDHTSASHVTAHPPATPTTAAIRAVPVSA
ncbi:ScbA/BarX family gamma-butyrolactone biosynthesis protein [Streptomyces chilikensis]|uniref:ScbA/BarX family gamma-butyrolactone biosynthesis protein n=1 Tax=Streptomyces chilikensis TaxID=1194079 RepID=UPI000B124BA8|nr:ScbA/BarX family gamma-butyrolactone biosynthesis protein [Streptomyces chilikensis]